MITTIATGDTLKTETCTLFRAGINTANPDGCVTRIEYYNNAAFMNAAQTNLYLFGMGTFIINFVILFIILLMRYTMTLYKKLENIFNSK